VQTVTTVSTFPPPGTFTRPADDIAKIMSTPEVSPKGLGSAIRMIQYFINRGGKNLSPQRRRELERAKRILQRRSGAAMPGFRQTSKRAADRRAT
jgi:tRNA(adenine34) deaminase